MITPLEFNTMLNELELLGLIEQQQDMLRLSIKGRQQIAMFKQDKPELFFLTMLAFEIMKESKK